MKDTLSGDERKWRVAPASELEGLAALWDGFQTRHARVPFLRARFIVEALRTFGSGREVVAICGDGTSQSMIGVFTPTRFGVWQSFQPSQLPLGAVIASPDGDLDAMLGSLLKVLPGAALSVSMTQQDPRFTSVPATSKTLSTLPYIDTAWIDASVPFDDYWQARGKNLRHNVKRQLTKLQADGITTELQRIDRIGDVAAAIADYGRLESAGWKSEGGTAVSFDNAQGRFYRTVFEAFCADGSASIFCYRVDGKLAAMDLCVQQGDVLVILKTAYDESLKSLSPAALMRFEYFRPLFDGGSVRRIEFYGRLMEWHTRWTSETRPLFHVNRYRWPWLSDLRDAMTTRKL